MAKLTAAEKYEKMGGAYGHTTAMQMGDYKMTSKMDKARERARLEHVSHAKSKALEGAKKGESWESAKNKHHEVHLSETKRHKRLDGTEVKY